MPLVVTPARQNPGPARQNPGLALGFQASLCLRITAALSSNSAECSHQGASRPQTYLQSLMGMWMVWRRRRSPLLRTAGLEEGFLHGAQGSELPAGHCLQTPLVQLQPPLCRIPCTPARRDHRVRTVTMRSAHTALWTTSMFLHPAAHLGQLCFLGKYN